MNRSSRRRLTCLVGIVVLCFVFLHVNLQGWHNREAGMDAFETLLERAKSEWTILGSDEKKLFVKPDQKMVPQEDAATKESSSKTQESVRGSQQKQDVSTKPSKVAGLNCDAYGGPPADVAKEMVYWQDIPSDSKFKSPFHSNETQFLTFEPDMGGWNNIRMGMETVLAMAYAMNRVLVLPPKQRYYLIDQNQAKVDTFFSFDHFFPIDDIALEHDGFRVISMKDFLRQYAIQGKLRDRNTGQVSFPPKNRTDWDGERKHIINQVLTPWLRNVTYAASWFPNKCIGVFPSERDTNGSSLSQQFQQSQKRYNAASYINNPTPVNASADLRLLELSAGRSRLCVYDSELQETPVLHFSTSPIGEDRLLVHYYAFLMFENWKQDVLMKRFVRDHVRYVDEIQCAAARVVQAVRKLAGGEYHSIHIRRGDFQFKETRVSARVIYDTTKAEWTENATVFVATDEKDKAFFNDLAEHYNLLYLEDFNDLLEGVNTNFFGMLDQLVASRGRTFFGCYYSTFTSYVNRLRGYHAGTSLQEGHETGAIESYYVAPKQFKHVMRSYQPVQQPFFAREFPTSWRGINEGIDD